MSISTTYWAWTKKNVTPLQKLTLIAITDSPEGGDDVSLCKFSCEYIAEVCNVASRDIKEVIQYFDDNNYLKIISKDLSENGRIYYKCKLNINDLPENTW